MVVLFLKLSCSSTKSLPLLATYEVRIKFMSDNIVKWFSFEQIDLHFLVPNLYLGFATFLILFVDIFVSYSIYVYNIIN